MRIVYIVFSILLGLGFSLSVKAQWDPQISQYWRVKSYFNPSFAGENDTLQASVLHRQQWVGIDNAPKSFIVSADMPLKFLGRKHGVGISVLTESIGLFKNLTVGGQYVYKKSWKRNTLNIGIQVGYSSIKLEGKVHIPQEQEGEFDPSLVNKEFNSNSAKVDGNIGVSWVTPKYYIGISSTHLWQPKYELDDNFIAYAKRLYYFTAGYNWKIRHSAFEIQPSVLVKTDSKIFQYDITGRVIYHKFLNGGISWRKDDGLVFLVGLNILGFDAGYAYDLSTSGISKASKGTHEFFLRYTIPMLQKKKGKFRHKSIRIL